MGVPRTLLATTYMKPMLNKKHEVVSRALFGHYFRQGKICPMIMTREAEGVDSTQHSHKIHEAVLRRLSVAE